MPVRVYGENLSLRMIYIENYENIFKFIKVADRILQAVFPDTVYS